MEDAHPGTRASRPHMAWRSLGHRRRRDGTVTGPCLSFGPANAVHAGGVAACRQRCADAPPPPARNKVAGETPAFPGVILEACKRRLARFLGVMSIRFPVCWVEDGPPGNAGVPPAHFPGTASADSAAGIDRQRGRALHSDWPLQFTPAGWLPAGNVAPTLHPLQPGIRLRARRPRSRGARRPRSRVGLRPRSIRWGADATPPDHAEGRAKQEESRIVSRKSSGGENSSRQCLERPACPGSAVPSHACLPSARPPPSGRRFGIPRPAPTQSPSRWMPLPAPSRRNT